MSKPTSDGSIIVTGANGGLGSAIVSKIVSTPELSRYHGIYTVRKAESAPTLRSVLKKTSASAHPHEILSLDLSNLDGIRKIASDINTRVASGELPPIRVLILNAGFNDLGKQEFTEDGYDMAFVATYLGHWLLTLLLLQSMDKKAGRIIVIGSNSYDTKHPFQSFMGMGGYYAEEKWQTFFHEDNIESIVKGTWSSNDVEPKYPEYCSMRRYGVSKMCAMMMVPELQKRLDTDPALSGVSITGIDPGVMGTDIARRGGWPVWIFFHVVTPTLASITSWTSRAAAPIFRTVSRSAEDVLAAAFDKDESRLRGRLVDARIPIEFVPEAKDQTKRGIVWRDSVKYTGLTKEETLLVNWA